MGNVVITPANPIVWATRQFSLTAWGNGSGGTGTYSWIIGGQRQTSQTGATCLYTPAAQTTYPVQLSVTVTDPNGNAGSTTLMVVDPALYGTLDFLTSSPDNTVILNSYSSPDAADFVASNLVSTRTSPSVPGVIQSFVALNPSTVYTQVMPNGIFISCYVLNVGALAASSTADWEQN